jgi:SAM-dependent methyltransferase
MSRGYIEAATELLHAIPGRAGLSFLELSCGDGRLIEMLRSEGATVRGTTFRSRAADYIRSREYPVGLTVDEGIDLNQPLPYPAATFDVVFSTEVIEHIEGHRMFLSESARVLKPNGWIMMTTPNLNRLVSRLCFLLSGVHLMRAPMPQGSTPLAQMEEFHHRCVDFPVLHWMLWQNGLYIHRLAPSSIHALSWMLLPLVPVARLFARPIMNHYGRSVQPADKAVRDDLVRWMTSPVALLSDQLCLLARKVGP